MFNCKIIKQPLVNTICIGETARDNTLAWYYFLPIKCAGIKPHAATRPSQSAHVGDRRTRMHPPPPTATVVPPTASASPSSPSPSPRRCPRRRRRSFGHLVLLPFTSARVVAMVASGPTKSVRCVSSSSSWAGVVLSDGVCAAAGRSLYRFSLYRAMASASAACVVACA